MSRFLLALSLILSGCSRDQTTATLTGTRWARALSDCGSDDVTFNAGLISTNPRGESPNVMYEIKSLRPSGSPGMIDASVEPGPQMLEVVKRAGVYRSGLRIRFRVTPSKLQAISSTLFNTVVYTPEDSTYQQFDLVACPASRRGDRAA
jgi:hypothetical protein